MNTAGRRKAEALIAAMHGASGSDPERTALHPDVIVNVPVDTLLTGESDPFDPPTVIDGGPITMGDLYRFAMLGTVSAMLTDPTDGRPLHLGRKVRLASGDQWIAGTIWHRGCVIPGCDRPAAWCQAHHDIFWRNGGATDLVNLPSSAPTTTSSTTTTGPSPPNPTAPGTSTGPTAPRSPHPATRQPQTPTNSPTTRLKSLRHDRLALTVDDAVHAAANPSSQRRYEAGATRPRPGCSRLLA